MNARDVRKVYLVLTVAFNGERHLLEQGVYYKVLRIFWVIKVSHFELTVHFLRLSLSLFPGGQLIPASSVAFKGRVFIGERHLLKQDVYYKVLRIRKRNKSFHLLFKLFKYHFLATIILKNHISFEKLNLFFTPTWQTHFSSHKKWKSPLVPYINIAVRCPYLNHVLLCYFQGHVD